MGSGTLTGGTRYEPRPGELLTPLTSSAPRVSLLGGARRSPQISSMPWLVSRDLTSTRSVRERPYFGGREKLQRKPHYLTNEVKSCLLRACTCSEGNVLEISCGRVCLVVLCDENEYTVINIYIVT